MKISAYKLDEMASIIQAVVNANMEGKAIVEKDAKKAEKKDVVKDVVEDACLTSAGVQSGKTPSKPGEPLY
ncbi:hypothetical protein COT95_01710 [Candidatus Falkowbacteria bacterium CG10_big_fil_rev_8_21_14_0_10_37_6]|uniref:Uncharacterized protein n=1 Tax=Candidatus Falkowbacteria bacterium CG10_big_fil_rev_8_21_14_0_10_37_6 TaxID=1974563 RepID=A0A2H0V750_9BACT|nr:MAG: hypothetical protein COT95_01710 [Candidatus Falkowbacteria bacterium CG10_big_fil_rev_8_21_14_0_10_37_6]